MMKMLSGEYCAVRRHRSKWLLHPLGGRFLPHWPELRSNGLLFVPKQALGFYGGRHNTISATLSQTDRFVMHLVLYSYFAITLRTTSVLTVDVVLEREYFGVLGNSNLSYLRTNSL